jgi:hypothetical protein
MLQNPNILEDTSELHSQKKLKADEILAMLAFGSENLRLPIYYVTL